MGSLDQFRKNIHSQNGEDGVILEICRRAGISVGTCVEFGAWDGKHLSNTYALIERGWSAVLIEGDQEKFRELKSNMAVFGDRIQPLCAMVQPDGPQSLDNLLSQTFLPKEFDLLSIDVDSTDWHIWAHLKRYTPKIVVIEINSSVPPGIRIVHGSGRLEGSSFSSTIELGRSKGYSAVCHTGNIIFVHDSLVAKLDVPAVELQFPELLFQYDWVK